MVGQHPRAQSPHRDLDLRQVDVDAAPGAAPEPQPGSKSGGNEARGQRIRDRGEGAERGAVGPSREEVEP